jgi:hypothetical protein
MKKCLFLLIPLFISISANAQQKITGKVIFGKDSSAIAGATITLKGTHVGTSTSADGSFTLYIPDSLMHKTTAPILVISDVGFSSTEVTIGNMSQESLSVALKENLVSLNETVVIGYGTKTTNDQQTVTFPWPPPESSAQSVVNKDYFKKAGTLKDVNSILSHALNYCGYSEVSYYYIPNGFAMVTRIEQIDEDGTSLDDADRWSVETSFGKLSWKKYLKSLFFSTPGYFRIIVFVVTDQPFTTSGEKVSKDAATKWLHKGLNVLPKEIGKVNFTSDYNCTALIYEFKKPESEDAFLLLPSSVTGSTHLKKSKIIDRLKGN